MSSRNQEQVLTERQQYFCEYIGAFGVMLTLTCLVQHFIVASSHWKVYLILFLYIFAIVAFLLLAFKKAVSPIVVMISMACSLTIQIMWMQSFAFSLVVICLFFYHVLAVAVLYAEGIPSALNQKRQAELEEEMKWAGKI